MKEIKNYSCLSTASAIYTFHYQLKDLKKKIQLINAFI